MYGVAVKDEPLTTSLAWTDIARGSATPDYKLSLVSLSYTACIVILPILLPSNESSNRGDVILHCTCFLCTHTDVNMPYFT